MTPEDYTIKKARPIGTTIRIPGDRHLTHRAVILGALANGPCLLSGISHAGDCLSTISAMRELGVKIDELSNDEAPPRASFVWKPEPSEDEPERSTALLVHGKSLELSPPTHPVDCGSSASTLLLLSGLLAAENGDTALHAILGPHRHDLPMLSKRLRAAGAGMKTLGIKDAPPYQFTNASPLKPLKHQIPSGQNLLKCALLLSGLRTTGTSHIEELGIAHDHTEHLLHAFQVRTRRSGKVVTIYGGQIPESRDLEIPGDFSWAAPWILAAAAQPGSELIIRHIGLNPRRTSLLRVLIRMGAHVREHFLHTPGEEPYGDLIIRGNPLHATTIEGEEIAELGDELPLIAVAAALATGTTIFRDAQALRTHITDRIASLAQNFQRLGITTKELLDGLEITGRGADPKLTPATLDFQHDPSVGAALAIAALFTTGESTVTQTACIEAQYPDFGDMLSYFQSRAISESTHTPVISTVHFLTKA